MSGDLLGKSREINQYLPLLGIFSDSDSCCNYFSTRQKYWVDKGGRQGRHSLICQLSTEQQKQHIYWKKGFQLLRVFLAPKRTIGQTKTYVREREVHQLLEKKLIESRIDRKKILVTKCQKFFPKISITLKYSWNLHQIFFHPPKFSITKKNSWNLYPKFF